MNILIIIGSIMGGIICIILLLRLIDYIYIKTTYVVFGIETELTSKSHLNVIKSSFRSRKKNFITDTGGILDIDKHYNYVRSVIVGNGLSDYGYYDGQEIVYEKLSSYIPVNYLDYLNIIKQGDFVIVNENYEDNFSSFSVPCLRKLEFIRKDEDNKILEYELDHQEIINHEDLIGVVKYKLNK